MKGGGTGEGREFQRVVVLGAGFGGLRCVRSLARVPVEITVVDKRNHHLFQPLLYQVATAALNPSDIAYPIRSILRHQANARTLLGRAKSIDLTARRVILDEMELSYDRLVIATGVTHSYFGHDDWREYVPGLKTIEDALEIRRRILLAFESAEREPSRSEEWMTFVVVGGGPTGVELAGSMAEIARHVLCRDFRAVDPTRARVILLEGGDRILSPYPTELSSSAQRQLQTLGVEVQQGALVVEIDEQGVTLASGAKIATRTVLWAAGVQGSRLARSLDVPLDRSGRVLVESDLSLVGHPEAFVIGDLASIQGADGPVPGVAPAAIQAGEHVARCLRADLAGSPRPEFRYRDRGSLATIGRARAVADFGRLRFSGYPAWLAWMMIHILFLIGFRNKLFVMLGWVWSYFSSRREARLITGGKDGRGTSEE